jgi:hypothetical protein
VLPLLGFVLLTFLVPIGYMLKRSIEHDGFSSSAPALDAWFAENPGFDPANPPEEAYAALVQDLARMQVEKTTGMAGHTDQLHGARHHRCSRRARARPRTCRPLQGLAARP